MEIVTNVLVFIHMLGMGALFGGAFVQVKASERVVNNAMLHGVLTQVVSGLLLVGVLEAGTEPVDHAKIAVKFAIGLVVLILVMANMRKPRIPDGLFYALLLLTVANVCVAVFWSTVHA